MLFNVDFLLFVADKQLPDSPQWKKNCTLLMETPVHKALITMKKMGSIA